MQLGKEMGLEGAKLLAFVQNQQKREEERRNEEAAREEKRRKLEEERRRSEDEEKEPRRQEHELRKLEMETELLKQEEAMEAAKREHELELARLGREQNPAVQEPNREDRAKAPKLPSFVDGKDDLNAYLQRFKDLHLMQKGSKPDGPLSPLLSEHARDVYSRVSEEDAINYDKMKLALMKMYDLTENGYRRKFRESKPETGESSDQFIVHLSNYLVRWLKLSNTERTFQGIKDLIVKEQFISFCPKELAVHLPERAPETLEEIAKIADQYLEAHGKQLFSPAQIEPPQQLPR